MKCEYCDKEATHTASVTDVESQGVNLNEPGYKTIGLCDLDAKIRLYYLGGEVKPIAEGAE